MNARGITVAAVAAALIVLAAGVVFTAVRDRNYESVATVVLSPDSSEPDRISNLLESFERSGTLGTYVELMASDDTTSEARALGVEITVRAVPDTRAIRLTATGDEEDVVAALRSVIDGTRAKQATLRDLFVLEVLEEPSAPGKAGPATGLLLLMTLLLSGFAALAVVVILRRVSPQPRRPQPLNAESVPRDR
jgi:CBS domain-containing protein